MARLRFVRWSLAFAALLASTAAAQQPRPIAVRPVRAAPVLGPLEYETGSSIVWLSDATLAITDGSEHQVVVFDTSGREIARLGRSGRGPGEFASGGPTVGIVDLAAGMATPAFAVFHADSALGAPMRVAGMAVPPPFLASATASDGVYLFGRPELPPVHRTPAEVQADQDRVQRAMQRAGVTPPPEAAQMLRDAQREMLARPKPYLTSVLAVDQLGRVWAVANRGSGDSSEVDVFSPRGEFLQTVVFRHRVTALSFRLPRVAVLAQHHGGPSDEQSEVSLYLVSGGEGGAGTGRRE